MSVEVSLNRKVVVLTYDTDLVQGDMIEVRAENPESGDVGNRAEGNNDGEALLFYPKDFTGTNEVTITGSDGGEDSGTITIS